MQPRFFAMGMALSMPIVDGRPRFMAKASAVCVFY